MTNLNRNKHHSPLHALLYYTDCQIATWEHFVYRKSVSKNETRRHYGITRDMLNQCRSFVWLHIPARNEGDRILIDAYNDLKRRFERTEAEYKKTPAGQVQ